MKREIKGLDATKDKELIDSITEPTKEYPEITEEVVDGDKITRTIKKYNEEEVSYNKGQIENYLNSAQTRLDEAQKDFDYWNDMMTELTKK